MAGLLTHGRSRVAILAGTVCALLAALLVAPAAAEHYEDVREVSAGDGVAAAAAYSKLAFPTGAANALLGRADVFPDSLASGVLQNDRPLLLTNNYNLSAPTKDELARLKVGTVTILGGLSAVSSKVEQELKDLGYRVNRINGSTRIETAIEVAKASAPGRTALLARGFGSADPTSAFADSLAAGGWAAEKDLPILLTESEKLSQPTADFLRGRIDQLFVVGGRAAISDAVITQARALGVAVTRVSGTNRFETAVAIAKARGFATAANASEVVLVDGQGANAWTDGFAVAAYAGRNKAPVVLANSAATSLPAATSTFLNAGPQADLLAGWTVPAAQVTQAAEGMDKDAVTTRVMQVALHGDNVVRTAQGKLDNFPIWGHGVRGKTGLLTMTIDEEANTIDYTFESQLTGPYAPLTPDNSGLVIRKAPLDARGSVALVRFPELNSTGKSSGTVTRSAYATGFHVRDLIQNATAHYAEAALDTSYRDGALRGQLPSGGTSHLPGKPTFSAITTSAGDNWITLKFATPVFSNVALVPAEDFAVTVDNGVPVTVESHDAPSKAENAKDTFVIKLVTGGGSPAPVANRETVVTLTQKGVAKLMNNLGDKVAAAPVSIKQLTPADTTPPQFIGIDAGANSNVVHLDFSEPVYTGALDLDHGTFSTRDIQVQFVTAGQTKNVGASDLGAISKPDRVRRISITLTGGETVPSNSEVRVTLANAAVGVSGIRDAADKQVSAPFSRSAVPSARAGFLSASATDLVVGGLGASSPATADQVQIITVTMQEPLAGGQALEIAAPAVTGISYTTAPTSTGLPPNTGMTGTGPWVFTLPSGNGLPEGAGVKFTFTGVSVNGGTAAAPGTSTETSGGTSGSFRVTRKDNGVTVQPTFDRRRGMHVTSADSLKAGKPTVASQNQNIAMTVRKDLPANGVISIELEELVALGVSYANATVTLATPADWRIDWAGGRTRIDITRLNSPAVEGTAMTVQIADVRVPDGVWGLGTRIWISRTEPTGVTGAVYRRLAEVRKDVESVSVSNVSAWGPGSSQTLSFTPVGPLTSSDQVVFTLQHSTLSYTGASVAVTTGSGSVTRAGGSGSNIAVTITYTGPTSGAAPSGSPITITISGINSSAANIVTSVPPTVQLPASWFRTSVAGLPAFLVTGAPEAALQTPVLFDDAQNGAHYGDEPGDVLIFDFNGSTSLGELASIKITVGAIERTISCVQQGVTPPSPDAVNCSQHPSTTTRWIATVSAPFTRTDAGGAPAPAPISNIATGSIADIQTGTANTRTDAYPGYALIQIGSVNS